MMRFICSICSGLIFEIMSSGMPMDFMCAKISFSVIFAHLVVVALTKHRDRKLGEEGPNYGESVCMKRSGHFFASNRELLSSTK